MHVTQITNEFLCNVLKYLCYSRDWRWRGSGGVEIATGSVNIARVTTPRLVPGRDASVANLA